MAERSKAPRPQPQDTPRPKGRGTCSRLNQSSGHSSGDPDTRRLMALRHSGCAIQKAGSSDFSLFSSQYLPLRSESVADKSCAPVCYGGRAPRIYDGLGLRLRSCESADVFEVPGEGDHAAGRLAPVEVFVGRVVAVLRKRETQEEDRRLENFLHREDRADRASFAHEDWLLAEGERD